MNRSMTFLSSRLVRRAAGWMANFLALASVSLLGRSAEAAANSNMPLDRNASMASHSNSEIQMSYLQVGTNKNDNQDWWPPLPE